MRQDYLPGVEVIQGHQAPLPERTGRRRRWKIFLGVLLLATTVGLVTVYARDPVYRANASVLAAQPRAIDRQSAAADVEHTSIQERLLLGGELLRRLSRQLHEDGRDLPLERLRGMLSAVTVADTNLLELRAEGTDPQLLQDLVNAWVRSYEGFRLDEIEALAGRTIAEIGDEAARLNGKIAAARVELQAFRRTNRIVGLARGENTALASMNGLNASLNRAREKLIEARARKAAIEAAGARGKTVIPDGRKSAIAKLRLDTRRKKDRLEQLRRKYTEVYIQADPRFRELPQQVEEQQRQLAEALRIGHATSLNDATGAVEQAGLAVVEIETRLEAQRERVELFNRHYKDFKALEENLSRLEKLQADNAQRLAQIEVRNLQAFPPIQVVQWARLPQTPIHLDYDRDLLIALGIALGLALFATWLADYLAERPAPAQAMPPFGVHFHTDDRRAALTARRGDAAQLGDDRPAAVLDSPPPGTASLPRELPGAEVQLLLGGDDPAIDACLALLLSGISPYELSLLHSASFDAGHRTVVLESAPARSIGLDAGTWQRIEPLRSVLDGGQARPSLAGIDGALQRAAHANSLEDPAGVNALALWHTYVLYLVRQGIDPRALEGRVGRIPPEVLGALLDNAPPGGPRAPGNVDFTYPALAY